MESVLRYMIQHRYNDQLIIEVDPLTIARL